jgi:hypothetical protein
MLINQSAQQIHIAEKPVDFRMSIDGLSELVKQNSDSNLYDGSYYVFVNRYFNKMKILHWDGTGFVLWYKRMEGTKFKINSIKDFRTISFADLMTIIAGNALKQPTVIVKKKQPKLIGDYKISDSFHD